MTVWNPDDKTLLSHDSQPLEFATSLPYVKIKSMAWLKGLVSLHEWEFSLLQEVLWFRICCTVCVYTIYVTKNIYSVVYIRFPVDSSQIPKGVVYFSPGCQMTLSPSVPLRPQPCWPFDQRHPVIRAKKHHSMKGLICSFGISCHIVWSPLMRKTIVIGQKAKKIYFLFQRTHIG